MHILPLKNIDCMTYSFFQFPSDIWIWISASTDTVSIPALFFFIVCMIIYHYCHHPDYMRPKLNRNLESLHSLCNVTCIMASFSYCESDLWHSYVQPSWCHLLLTGKNKLPIICLTAVDGISIHLHFLLLILPTPLTNCSVLLFYQQSKH